MIINDEDGVNTAYFYTGMATGALGGFALGFMFAALLVFWVN